MNDSQDKFLSEVLQKSAYYQEQFNKLDNETLAKVANNRSVALEYAKKAIEQDTSVSLTEDLLVNLANEMQTRAKTILEERSEQK